jgi:hypothetical protein
LQHDGFFPIPIEQNKIKRRMQIDIIELGEKCNVNFVKFDGHVDVKTEDEYIKQIKKIMNTNVAKETNRIAYVWTTEEEIKRLKEGSNILYIGETEKNIRSRHYKYIGRKNSRLNWTRNRHIRDE